MTAKLHPGVVAELIRLLYRHLPTVLAANLINGALVVFALWSHADRPILLGWAAMCAALTLLRAGLWLDFRTDSTTRDIVKWGKLYTVGAAVSGLVWGSTSFLFIDHGHPITLILIAFVIGGMGAGAVTGLSAHMPAFQLYLMGSVLPLVMRLLMLDDRVSLAMAAMASIYFVGLIVIGRSFNDALVRSFELDEENRRLLQSRAKEVEMRTADLRAANRELENEILERKASQVELVEARAEAERANQSKSRFLAAVSHDLRQPLQSILLFVASLKYYVTNEKGLEILTRTTRSLDILKNLLDGLLDLSRLDVDAVKPNMAVFRLRPMLEDMVAAYADIAAAKGLRLESGPFGDVSVRSDEMLLGRMIRNLMENALRYTEHGRILLSTHALGDMVRIEITDTGIGIPSDQLERIFEEFHQIENPGRDKERGLGLGLAIVGRLSLILGHPLEVQSQLRVGSTFSIRLPSVKQAPALPAATIGHNPSAMGYGYRAIVIDDDPQVRLALGSILTHWKFDVTMAGSLDEALDLLDPRAPPELIVADYRLRAGQTGTESIRTIRAACGTRIPSVLVTGETGRDWLPEAESLGAVVLFKPVRPDDLVVALRRLDVVIQTWRNPFQEST